MPFAVAAGIGAAGTIIGGVLQKSATDKAAGQAQQRFDQGRADLEPYRTAGVPALEQQNALLGLAGPEAADAAFSTYRTSPGYQFQMDEGLRAVDQGAAARGILRSGATLKAEQEFGANLADSDFAAYYNRLMGLSDLGARSAGASASSSNTAGNAAQNAGNTTASIYGNVASGLGNIANDVIANPRFQNWWNGTGQTNQLMPADAWNNSGTMTALSPASGLPVFYS